MVYFDFVLAGKYTIRPLDLMDLGWKLVHFKRPNNGPTVCIPEKLCVFTVCGSKCLDDDHDFFQNRDG